MTMVMTMTMIIVNIMDHFLFCFVFFFKFWLRDELFFFYPFISEGSRRIIQRHSMKSMRSLPPPSS